MIKVALWVVGEEKDYLTRALEILGKQENGLLVIGAISEGDRKKFAINSQEVPMLGVDEFLMKRAWDYVLVTGGRCHMPAVTKKCKVWGISPDSFISDRAVCAPGFTLEKYFLLRHSQLSILSMNCFGGLISSLLQLEFLTPTINMFLKEDEFLKFLSEPRKYMETQLELIDKVQEKGRVYPVFSTGGVHLYMNHYFDFDAASKKWYERVKRINWYNVIPVMYTKNAHNAELFDKLPFGKKVCFTDFASDFQSSYFLPVLDDKELPLWDRVNHVGMGLWKRYDLFNMLLYGIKTPIYRK